MTDSPSVPVQNGFEVGANICCDIALFNTESHRLNTVADFAYALLAYSLYCMYVHVSTCGTTTDHIMQLTVTSCMLKIFVQTHDYCQLVLYQRFGWWNSQSFLSLGAVRQCFNGH